MARMAAGELFLGLAPIIKAPVGNHVCMWSGKGGPLDQPPVLCKIRPLAGPGAWK